MMKNKILKDNEYEKEFSIYIGVGYLNGSLHR